MTVPPVPYAHENCRVVGCECGNLARETAAEAPVPSDTDRPRNQHCMNCGDTRGGPMGHETQECTHDSLAGAVRAALRPGFAITLSQLIAEAQQDAHPLADAVGSTGPYIVQGCVVYGAQQLRDALRTVWKHTPKLLDELETARAEAQSLQGRLTTAEGRQAIARANLVGQAAGARGHWQFIRGMEGKKSHYTPEETSFAEGYQKGTLSALQTFLESAGEVVADDECSDAEAIVEAALGLGEGDGQ